MSIVNHSLLHSLQKKCERTANARAKSSRRTDLFCPCALLIFIVTLPKPIGSINQKKNIGPSIPQSQFKKQDSMWDTNLSSYKVSSYKIPTYFNSVSIYNRKIFLNTLLLTQILVDRIRREVIPLYCVRLITLLINIEFGQKRNMQYLFRYLVRHWKRIFLAAPERGPGPRHSCVMVCGSSAGS